MPITAAGVAAAGSFLSGASSFLGGLGIGGGEKRPRYRDALQAQMYATGNDIDTKIKKAKEHGIHPLTMLGVPGVNAPSAYVPGNKGPDLNAMGQGIDRMANFGRTQLSREIDEANLEQVKLSNDFMRVQIAGAQQAIAKSGQTPPLSSGVGPYLLDGQTGSGSIAPKPAEPTLGVTPQQPQREGGAYPEIAYKRTSPTELRLVPSKDQKERMEDDIFEQVKYHSRHSFPVYSSVRNMIKNPPYPSEVPLPPGYKKWVWSYDRWKASKR